MKVFPFQNMRNFWRILAIAAVILIAVSFVSVRPGANSTAGQIASVRRGDLKIEVTATGSLVAQRASDIGPPYVEGLWDFKIARLVDEGTQVKPGDMLIEFDGQEVNRRLTEQQADMQKTEEELNKRKLEYDIQLRDLRIRVEESKVKFEKAKHKAEVDASLISMQDYKQAQIELELAQTESQRLNEKLEATLRMQKAELAALQNNLQNTRNRVGRLQDQQKALKVVAPSSGVVIYKRSWNGEKKQVGQSAWRLETIMQIPDLSTLRLEAMVEEVNAGGVSPGQRVTIRLDAFPELKLAGRVASVGTVLRTKRFDIPIKVVDAIITLDHREGKLLPGMTATALIEVQRIPNVLMVPLTAVRERQGRAVVTVLSADGKRSERQVRVGRRNTESIEVTEGLKEGDRVAVL